MLRRASLCIEIPASEQLGDARAEEPTKHLFRVLLVMLGAFDSDRKYQPSCDSNYRIYDVTLSHTHGDRRLVG